MNYLVAAELKLSQKNVHRLERYSFSGRKKNVYLLHTKRYAWFYIYSILLYPLHKLVKRVILIIPWTFTNSSQSITSLWNILNCPDQLWRVAKLKFSSTDKHHKIGSHDKRTSVVKYSNVYGIHCLWPAVSGTVAHQSVNIFCWRATVL
jgi:hypothetical protein